MMIRVSVAIAILNVGAAISAEVMIGGQPHPESQPQWHQHVFSLVEVALDAPDVTVAEQRHAHEHHDDAGWGMQLLQQGPTSSQAGLKRRELSMEQMMGDMGSPEVWTIYMGAILMTAGLITFLYWNRGLGTVCKVLVYLTALSTMKLAVKLVYVNGNFHYPKFVTSTHFIVGGLSAFAVMLNRQLRTGVPMVKPSGSDFMLMICPIAASFALSVAANNMALIYCTAAFAEMVGATTPVVTVGVVLVMGKPFAMQLLIPTLLVVLGTMVCATGEVSFSLLGFTLAFGANVFRAIKATLQQEILKRGGPEGASALASFGPVELLAWMCLPSSMLMVCWSLVDEGVRPYTQIMTGGDAVNILSVVGLSCVNATILNLAVLFVIKDLGAVGTQLIAQAKSILTILGGMALFGDQVSPLEGAGFLLVMIGVYVFNSMEKRLAEAREAANKLKKVEESGEEANHLLPKEQRAV